MGEVYTKKIIGNITALNGAVSIDLSGRSSCAVLLDGTWVATITPQVSVDDGVTWENTKLFDISAETMNATVTTNGTYTIAYTAGCTHARVTATAFTSGTVNVTASASSGNISVSTATITGDVSLAGDDTDMDTGAGTDNHSVIAIGLPAAGGHVVGGTSTNPFRTDTVGTTTQPVSGTVTSNQGTNNATPWNENIAQFNGVTPLMGNGVTGTGSPRVTIASDNTAFSTNAIQSGAWNITNITGTVSLPTGASTAAKQPALGTAGTASADVISIQGIASMTAVKVDGSAVTQPVSGTITANQGTNNATPWNENVAQINGVTPLMGNGIAGTGSQRVTIASDNTAFSVNIGTFPDNEPFNISQINGVTPLMGNGVTGTGSQRVTIASDNTAFSVNIGTFPDNEPFNVAQINGVAVSMGNGVSGTGVQRVTIASDSTGVVGSSPTASATATGSDIFRTAALTNVAQAVKASAGTFYGYHFQNPNTSGAWVQIYNVAAGSVTVGTTTPNISFFVPAGGALDTMGSVPIAFGTAISTAATTTAGGGTAPTTNLVANVFYK